MQWYYSKNGTQLGPISEGELRSKLASGEVSPTDLVWKEGMSDWQPSARVAELASIAAIPSATSPIPPSLGNVPPSPYSPPQSQPAPAYPPGQVTYVGHIPTNLWQSIVVTLFCCLPFGIVAIVYAAKVDGLKLRGDIAGATTAAATSRMWTNVSVLVWGAFVVLSILVNIFGGRSH
jgi:hypothetical protein